MPYSSAKLTDVANRKESAKPFSVTDKFSAETTAEVDDRCSFVKLSVAMIAALLKRSSRHDLTV